jgi:O-methyltransferase involved in polyketide biosynthesis
VSIQLPKFDPTKPHAARVYAYLLGEDAGKDALAADRDFAEKMIAAWPEVRIAARANRYFMHRAARWLVEQGVRQFIDIGTGLPVSPNLHEIVQEVDPRSRILYVDNDPLVVAHARALMNSDQAGVVDYIQADVRDTDAILAEAARVFDMSKPVALVMVSLLHYLPDEYDAYGVVGRLVGGLPPGSYFAMTHGTYDPHPPERRTRMEQLWQLSPHPAQVRTLAEVERFFDGLELVEPGIVPMAEWRPEGKPPPFGEAAFYGGVARKP